MAIRDTVSDWIEVKSVYWKIFISKSHLERCEDGLIIWQLVSLIDNKKMKSCQSSISKNRYYFENKVFETIYECRYRLPMCEGEVVDEFLVEKKYFHPIPEAIPAHAILAIVKNWN